MVPPTEQLWKKLAIDNGSVVRMIRGMIEEMFGAVANMESEDATLLLRGPEIKHDGEAILAALNNIKKVMDSD